MGILSQCIWISNNAVHFKYLKFYFKGLKILFYNYTSIKLKKPKIVIREYYEQLSKYTFNILSEVANSSNLKKSQHFF